MSGKKRPLHIVVGDNEADGETIVITVYEPEQEKWDRRFQKENSMKCVICKHAETVPGTTTVTLERDGFTYVIKSVPAQVCPNCGEACVDEMVTGELLKSAEQMADSGAMVDIRQYKAA